MHNTAHCCVSRFSALIFVCIRLVLGNHLWTKTLKMLLLWQRGPNSQVRSTGTVRKGNLWRWMLQWNRKHQKERWLCGKQVKVGERRDSQSSVRMRNIRDPVILSSIAYSLPTCVYIYVHWAYTSSFADLSFSLPQGVRATFSSSFVTLHSQPRNNLSPPKIQFPAESGWNSAPYPFFLFTWGHWMPFIHKCYIFYLLTGGFRMLVSTRWQHKRPCRNARYSCDVFSSLCAF